MNGQSGPCGQPGVVFLSVLSTPPICLVSISRKESSNRTASVTELDVFFAVFRSCADMPLFVENMCALFQKETVDSVMPRRFPAACVDAASGYDGDISPCAYIKIIVDKVVTFCGLRRQGYKPSLSVLRSLYDLRTIWEHLLLSQCVYSEWNGGPHIPVFTDIERTAEFIGKISDNLQEFF